MNLLPILTNRFVPGVPVTVMSHSYTHPVLASYNEETKLWHRVLPTGAGQPLRQQPGYWLDIQA